MGTLGDGGAAKRIKDLASSMYPAFLAMANVPREYMEIDFVDGPGEEDAAADTGTDSYRSSRTSESNPVDGPQMRITATIRAPGLHASWASGGLKKAMADGEEF